MSPLLNKVITYLPVRCLVYLQIQIIVHTSVVLIYPLNSVSIMITSQCLFIFVFFHQFFWKKQSEISLFKNVLYFTSHSVSDWKFGICSYNNRFYIIVAHVGINLDIYPTHLHVFATHIRQTGCLLWPYISSQYYYECVSYSCDITS